jgi:hypothetical protein
MKANLVPSWRRCLPLALICVATGCGVAAYEERMNSTVEGYKRTAKFNQLSPPIKLAGGNVSIRIPLKFGKPYKVGETGIEAAQNVTPLFLKLPGANLGYVDTAKDGNKVTDYHCYVAVIETPPVVTGQPKLGDLILADLNKAFPKANPPLAWQGPVKCDTDEGDPTPLEWYTITAAADDLGYNRKENDQISFEKIKGTFELWLLERADYTVLIGWNVPVAIDGAINFDTTKYPPGVNGPPLLRNVVSKLMAGTVKIYTPPALTAEAVPEMGDEVRIGAYKMRLPAGFKPGSLPGAPPVGTQILYWQADATNTLKVSSTITPLNKTPQSLEQTLFAAIKGLGTVTLPEGIKHGKVNNLRFVRAKYQAQGSMGVIYVGTDGQTVFERPDEGRVKALDASAVTFAKG